MPTRWIEWARKLQSIAQTGLYYTANAYDAQRYEAVRDIAAEMLAQTSLSFCALGAIRHHHERLDGSGYPRGLTGPEIPLMARIIGVADALDAMTRVRPYHDALSVAEAVSELKRHRGQTLDGHAELPAAVGVLPGNAERRLGDPQRLRRDPQPRPVHQARHVADKAELPLPDELARHIVVDQFAGRRSVDPQLLLEMSDLQPWAPLDQQQAQTAAVLDLRLAPRQCQDDVSAAVGDEPLDARKSPSSVVILPGPQAHRLQVAAGVRLGQGHRPGHLTTGEPREVLVLDRLVSEGVDRLADPLQTEDIHE